MDIKFYVNSFHRFNGRITHFIGTSPVDYIKTWFSEMYCGFRYGCSFDDYFRYEFYKKSNYERNKFITYRRSKNLIQNCNDPEYICYFNDKATFNTKFSAFIHRDWIDCHEATDEELQSFITQHERVLIKPRKGGQGKGIRLITINDYRKGLVNGIDNCIAEEVLIQHPELSKLNPSSVNSIRVLTYNGDIIAAALRMGSNKSIVDNLHSDGICGHIDLQSGVIDILGVDNNMNKYLYHPNSRVLLPGFIIPNWDQLIACVKEAAGLVKQVKYVGWDVAVLEDGIAIIEGNHDPGHDIVQMIAQTGLWSELKRNH